MPQSPNSPSTVALSNIDLQSNSQSPPPHGQTSAPFAPSAYNPQFNIDAAARGLSDDSSSLEDEIDPLRHKTPDGGAPTHDPAWMRSHSAHINPNPDLDQFDAQLNESSSHHYLFAPPYYQPKFYSSDFSSTPLRAQSYKSVLLSQEKDIHDMNHPTSSPCNFWRHIHHYLSFTHFRFQFALRCALVAFAAAIGVMRVRNEYAISYICICFIPMTLMDTWGGTFFMVWICGWPLLFSTFMPFIMMEIYNLNVLSVSLSIPIGLAIAALIITPNAHPIVYKFFATFFPTILMIVYAEHADVNLVYTCAVIFIIAYVGILATALFPYPMMANHSVDLLVRNLLRSTSRVSYLTTRGFLNQPVAKKASKLVNDTAIAAAIAPDATNSLHAPVAQPEQFNYHRIRQAQHAINPFRNGVFAPYFAPLLDSAQKHIPNVRQNRSAPLFSRPILPYAHFSKQLYHDLHRQGGHTMYHESYSDTLTTETDEEHTLFVHNPSSTEDDDNDTDMSGPKKYRLGDLKRDHDADSELDFLEKYHPTATILAHDFNITPSSSQRTGGHNKALLQRENSAMSDTSVDNSSAALSSSSASPATRLDDPTYGLRRFHTYFGRSHDTVHPQGSWKVPSDDQIAAVQRASPSNNYAQVTSDAALPPQSQNRHPASPMCSKATAETVNTRLLDVPFPELYYNDLLLELNTMESDVDRLRTYIMPLTVESKIIRIISYILCCCFGRYKNSTARTVPANPFSIARDSPEAQIGQKISTFFPRPHWLYPTTLTARSIIAAPYSPESIATFSNEMLLVISSARGLMHNLEKMSGLSRGGLLVYYLFSSVLRHDLKRISWLFKAYLMNIINKNTDIEAFDSSYVHALWNLQPHHSKYMQRNDIFVALYASLTKAKRLNIRKFKQSDQPPRGCYHPTEKDIRKMAFVPGTYAAMSHSLRNMWVLYDRLRQIACRGMTRTKYVKLEKALSQQRQEQQRQIQQEQQQQQPNTSPSATTTTTSIEQDNTSIYLRLRRTIAQPIFFTSSIISPLGPYNQRTSPSVKPDFEAAAEDAQKAGRQDLADTYARMFSSFANTDPIVSAEPQLQPETVSPSSSAASISKQKSRRQRQRSELAHKLPHFNLEIDDIVLFSNFFFNLDRFYNKILHQVLPNCTPHLYPVTSLCTTIPSSLTMPTNDGFETLDNSNPVTRALGISTRLPLTCGTVRVARSVTSSPTSQQQPAQTAQSQQVPFIKTVSSQKRVHYSSAEPEVNIIASNAVADVAHSDSSDNDGYDKEVSDALLEDYNVLSRTGSFSITMDHAVIDAATNFVPVDQDDEDQYDTMPEVSSSSTPRPVSTASKRRSKQQQSRVSRVSNAAHSFITAEGDVVDGHELTLRDAPGGPVNKRGHFFQLDILNPQRYEGQGDDQVRIVLDHEDAAVIDMYATGDGTAMDSNYQRSDAQRAATAAEHQQPSVSDAPLMAGHGPSSASRFGASTISISTGDILVEQRLNHSLELTARPHVWKAAEVPRWYALPYYYSFNDLFELIFPWSGLKALQFLKIVFFPTPVTVPPPRESSLLLQDDAMREQQIDLEALSWTPEVAQQPDTAPVPAAPLNNVNKTIQCTNSPELHENQPSFWQRVGKAFMTVVWPTKTDLMWYQFIWRSIVCMCCASWLMLLPTPWRQVTTLGVHWPVLTVGILLAPDLGSSFSNMFNRIVANVMGAFYAYLLIIIAQYLDRTMWNFGSGAIICCGLGLWEFYWTWTKSSRSRSMDYCVPAAVSPLVVALSGIHGAGETFVMHRLSYTLYGAMIAMLGSILIFPIRGDHSFFRQLSGLLTQFSQLVDCNGQLYSYSALSQYLYDDAIFGPTLLPAVILDDHPYAQEIAVNVYTKPEALTDVIRNTNQKPNLTNNYDDIADKIALFEQRDAAFGVLRYQSMEHRRATQNTKQDPVDNTSKAPLIEPTGALRYRHPFDPRSRFFQSFMQTCPGGAQGIGLRLQPFPVNASPRECRAIRNVNYLAFIQAYDRQLKARYSNMRNTSLMLRARIDLLENEVIFSFVRSVHREHIAVFRQIVHDIMQLARYTHRVHECLVTHHIILLMMQNYYNNTGMHLSPIFMQTLEGFLAQHEDHTFVDDQWDDEKDTPNSPTPASPSASTSSNRISSRSQLRQALRSYVDYIRTHSSNGLPAASPQQIYALQQQSRQIGRMLQVELLPLVFALHANLAQLLKSVLCSIHQLVDQTWVRTILSFAVSIDVAAPVFHSKNQFMYDRYKQSVYEDWLLSSSTTKSVEPDDGKYHISNHQAVPIRRNDIYQTFVASTAPEEQNADSVKEQLSILQFDDQHEDQYFNRPYAYGFSINFIGYRFGPFCLRRTNIKQQQAAETAALSQPPKPRSFLTKMVQSAIMPSRHRANPHYEQAKRKYEQRGYLHDMLRITRKIDIIMEEMNSQRISNAFHSLALDYPSTLILVEQSFCAALQMLPKHTIDLITHLHQLEAE